MGVEQNRFGSLECKKICYPNYKIRGDPPTRLWTLGAELGL